MTEAEWVVPGHGEPISGERAQTILAEDRAYLEALVGDGEAAALPEGRRTDTQRKLPRRQRRPARVGLTLAGATRAAVMTASVSPLETAAPATIGSSEIVPDLCAVISFSIFIASITADQRALLDRRAGLHRDPQDRALQRRGERVAAAAAAPAARSARRGGRRATRGAVGCAGAAAA